MPSSISKQRAKEPSRPRPPPIPMPAALPPTLPTLPNGVRRYVLDMDLPPTQRYAHIIADHKAHLGLVDAYVEGEAKALAGPLVGAFALRCLQGVMNVGNKLALVYYSEELKAIAELSGMPLGRVVLMQLIYEASALCTSVVVPMTAGGEMGHARTMDWEMDLLKRLTIDVEVRQGGVTKFIGTTWAGYVGILTGVAVRPQQARDGFSVSVNFRSVGSGTLGTNVKCALTRSWPIGFLVRETLMRADNYATCVSWLTNSKLIAPCYFTVCGARPLEGALITRCRDASIRARAVGDGALMGAHDLPPRGEGPSHGCARADVGGASHCLVQPNMDHWSSAPDEDILYSVRRRACGYAAMGALMRAHGVTEGLAARRGGAVVADAIAEQAHLSRREGSAEENSPTTAAIPPAAIWEAMSGFPITSEITIYGTLMSPSAGTLETRVPMGSSHGRRHF